MSGHAVARDTGKASVAGPGRLATGRLREVSSLTQGFVLLEFAVNVIGTHAHVMCEQSPPEGASWEDF